ncbi:MlaE family lipid ABC transporter permease subunit [Desulfothermus okinawensis JCM 13304]
MKKNDPKLTIELSIKESKCEIFLNGELVIETLNQLFDFFNRTKLNFQLININCTNLYNIDISGGFAIKKICNDFKNKDIIFNIVNLDTGLKRVIDTIDFVPFEIHTTNPNKKNGILYYTGRFICKLKDDIIEFLYFLGEFVVTFFYVLFGKLKIRFNEIFYEVENSGVYAIPIVSLVGLLSGIVLSYQGAAQLEKFGANIFIVDLISLSISREMAPLLTSIMVAGRSGSSYTARIGSMMLNQEIDSLKIIGVSPMELLVVPKLIAMLISLPLLIFIADLVGIGSGIYLSHFLLNLDFTTMLIRLKSSLSLISFLIGIFKGFIFAVPIVLISCFRGFSVRYNSDELGIKTTMSVVNTIFIVIVIDAILSILFQKVGI